MEVIPAIDLANQLVVRLKKGDLSSAVIYQDFGNPIQVAKKWEREGANALHIVDLNAAVGTGDNKEIVIDIISTVQIPVQLGGGLRSKRHVEEIFAYGLWRAILGTMAFEKTSDLLYLVNKFGKEKIMVALDYLKHQVMIRGWSGKTHFTVEKALNKFLKLGVKTFMLTSISRDGLLTGPDYKMLKTIATKIDASIYAAGGISTLTDLARLKEINVKGVIIGKALYERKFTLKEAIRAAKN